MNKSILLLISVLMMPLLSSCMTDSDAASSPSEVAHVELASGHYTDTGMTTRKQSKIILSQQDYAAELANYSSSAPMEGDFAAGKVLLVDMGPRSTGGYSIGVTSVDDNENYVVANVRLFMPGQNCVVTQAVTNPYQFVFVSSVKEILISESLEVNDC